MSLQKFFGDLGASVKGAGKMLVLSRRASLRAVGHDRPLVVLGNGPSLNKTLEEQRERLAGCDLMAVNFAANAPVFSELRPKYYILADPFFFSGKDVENLVKLWRGLAQVDWPMSLLVPVEMRKKAEALVAGNTNINVLTFNAVGVEGFGCFRNMAYGSRLAMPRPRNVLIPAIMCGIWLGYSTIYIAGADHSWMQTIYVDDNNHVVSVQPHFYSDSEQERARVYAEYEGYRLHDIVHSFYVAFRAYHDIRAFADHRGVSIVNITPGSYIDAFPRASAIPE